MSQPFVVWDDKYSIGIDTVDEQHKGLFALANDLYDACQGNNFVASERFKEILQEAINYVALHFGTEEDIMKKTGDPNYEEHQKEHDLFVRKVIKEASSLEQGAEDAPIVFMNFLRDWIDKHVTGTDVKIGQHIQDLKSRGEIGANEQF